MTPYFNTMLTSNRILFGSLPVFIELPERILAVTLNVFSKSLSEVYRKGIVWQNALWALCL